MPSNNATFIKAHEPFVVKARPHNQKFIDVCNLCLSVQNADYELYIGNNGYLEQVYIKSIKSDMASKNSQDSLVLYRWDVPLYRMYDSGKRPYAGIASRDYLQRNKDLGLKTYYNLLLTQLLNRE